MRSADCKLQITETPLSPSRLYELVKLSREKLMPQVKTWIKKM